MAPASEPPGGFDSHTNSTAHQHGRPLNQDSPWARQNVLTFDGGGVRGYYSLLLLQYLMKRIQMIEEKFKSDQESKNETISSFSPCVPPRDFSYSARPESHFLPCHYFDYISGTSTGALITIMLTTLRMSVDDCLEEYETLAGQVFGQPRPVHHAGELGVFVKKNKYATTNLENAIKDVLRRRGELAHDHDDAMQFRTPKGLCRAIVFSSRSIEGVFKPLWVFRSYDNFSAQTADPAALPLNPGRGTNLAAWKVARAATAAYLYFKPLEIALDDGEVMRRKPSRLRTLTGDSQPPNKKKQNQRRTRTTALLSDAGFSRTNNPSMNVLDELRTIFRNGPKKVSNWVSIGTARRTAPHGISTLRSILKKAVAELGDPEGEHQRMSQLHPREFDYYRLNEPNGLPDVDMDAWKPRRSNNPGNQTIKDMTDAFHRWSAQPANQDSVQQAAQSLVDIRRARTLDDSRWERFALGRLFTCPANDCHLDSDETWNYRDSFIRHLREDHGYNEYDVNRAVRNSSRDWQYKPKDAYL